MPDGSAPGNGFLEALRRDLAALDGRGLRRALRVVEHAEGTRIVVAGRALVNFASNDYLGLAQHPKLRAAVVEAVLREGWGAGASRLLSGTRAAHTEAERRLAVFRGAPAALLFPTGYAANLGLFQALAGDDCAIASDALNHASLIDACRLSRARVVVFPHRDVAAARRALADAPSARRRLLVTDTVFSMDGDLAPLPDLLAAARETGSVLIADDAHGNGVLGASGRGAIEMLGIDPAAPDVVIVATLSKAFGGLGGFVAAAREVIDWLVTRARTFMYTTGIAPAAAAAAIAALDLMAAEPWRRERVRTHARRLRETLCARRQDLARAWSPESWDVPIVPVIVGEPTQATAVASRLFQRGFFAPAIRPPTVPDGTARLRISLSADHTAEDVQFLADALAECLQVS
jgi:8-amino-7-oxononanoate synthase